VALEAELMIVGERQGLIVGPGEGRPEGETRVHRVANQVVVPRSPVTGLSTHKRYRKPLSLRRHASRASIALYNSFAAMENLTEVCLRFFLPTALGAAKHVYTIQLFNAHIVSFRTVQPYTHAGPRGLHTALNEEVSFTYLTIQCTWVSTPPMVSTDDWLAAR
jgi:type VI secretion system Hcp family effector